MNKIDWRTVILKIKKERGWKLKTIADAVSVSRDTLDNYQSGNSEPRHSTGEEMLKLAGMVDG